MLGSFTLANESGRFKAVHLGHVDVEQNDRIVVFEQTSQGLAPGVSLDNVLAKLLERGFDRHDLFRHVVDDKYVDWLAGFHEIRLQVSDRTEVPTPDTRNLAINGGSTIAARTASARGLPV